MLRGIDPLALEMKWRVGSLLRSVSAALLLRGIARRGKNHAATRISDQKITQVRGSHRTTNRKQARKRMYGLS